MTGNPLLDGAAIAVSLFNTMLLIWLGLTVLLNADRRAWGIWLGSGGLLLGGAFFVSHTAILSLGLVTLGWNMVFWWTVGLVPAIALPFAWYLVVLWYAGFWEERDSDLRRRQRFWFWLTIGMLLLGFLGLAAGVFLLVAPWDRYMQWRFFIRWSIAGIPLLALGYSVYVVLCIGLSLDALRRPGPVRRTMGTLARQRARPWLTAVSLTLLLVGLLTIGVLGWLVQSARFLSFYDVFQASAHVIALLDLLIASIVGVAVVLLGQAIVSYEVFTGKTLPRQGLLKQWRRALVFAAGYSLLVWGSMFFALRPIYGLLLTAILISFLFALFGWRTYRERERYFADLRPFVSSQRLYEQLLVTAGPTEVDIGVPFRTLCRDVLDTRVAYLVAVGPLAPLVGPPLVYPARRRGSLPPFADIAQRLARNVTHAQAPIPISPEQHGEAVWAIPLWSERGLIGLFLLGRRWNDGLYAQEEIDIARVSGERLIDTKASAEMARRLMRLQRERLASSQVIDQQTRRVLHDDILPMIQMAIITLSGETAVNQTVQTAVDTLTDAHKQVSNLLREMPTTKAPEVARLGLVTALRQTVDIEFSHAFDEVAWHVDPETEKKAKGIPTLTAEVIFYAAREAVRNAAKYGRGEKEEAFCLRITISRGQGLQLQVEDNGVGLDTGSPARGSGQGLALHTTMMAVIGGELITESVPGAFTRVTLTLPEVAGE